MPKMGTHGRYRRLLDDKATLRRLILNNVAAHKPYLLAFHPSVPFDGRGYPGSST